MNETLIKYDESRDTPETFKDNAAETRLRNLRLGTRRRNFS